MKIYLLINEWCNTTESGYDVIAAFKGKKDAEAGMFTMHTDFMHGCDRGEIEGFEDYTIDEGNDSLTIISNVDNNLFERHYITEKRVL